MKKKKKRELVMWALASYATYLVGEGYKPKKVLRQIKKTEKSLKKRGVL